MLTYIKKKFLILKHLDSNWHDCFCFASLSFNSNSVLSPDKLRFFSRDLDGVTLNCGIVSKCCKSSRSVCVVGEDFLEEEVGYLS